MCVCVEKRGAAPLLLLYWPLALAPSRSRASDERRGSCPEGERRQRHYLPLVEGKGMAVSSGVSNRRSHPESIADEAPQHTNDGGGFLPSSLHLRRPRGPPAAAPLAPKARSRGGFYWGKEASGRGRKPTLRVPNVYLAAPPPAGCSAAHLRAAAVAAAAGIGTQARSKRGHTQQQQLLACRRRLLPTSTLCVGGQHTTSTVLIHPPQTNHTTTQAGGVKQEEARHRSFLLLLPS